MPLSKEEIEREYRQVCGYSLIGAEPVRELPPPLVDRMAAVLASLLDSIDHGYLDRTPAYLGVAEKEARVLMGEYNQRTRRVAP